MKHAPTRKRRRRRSILAAAACAALVLLLPARRGEGADGDDPYIGYLYPAGARAGTTVQVLAGGQNLRGLSEAIVSGMGVKARVIDLLPAWRPLDGPTSRVILFAIMEAREAKRAAQERRPPPAKRTLQPEIGPDGKPEKPTPLPDHPLLKNLDKCSLAELQRIADYFLKPRNLMQIKRAIAEVARLEIVIDAGAAPGPRELRLHTAEGLTDPLRFDVGTLPEVIEGRSDALSDDIVPAAEVPIVWNGQIQPKEVDRWRFRAKEGQSLVIRTDARHLVPYQADSVPGWMQAVVAVYDSDGKEVAYADDWRFDPDPVLLFPVKASGEYVLEIRDALYRGREDFVYRVTVSDEPFVAGVFPLGGRLGAKTDAMLSGWNLPWTRVALDTLPGVAGTRWAAWSEGTLRSNRVPYVVDAWPEADEVEPNDTVETAQQVSLPLVVNGRIGKPGDVDWLRLYGEAGDDVVVEVQARRLGSPLDSLLRLVDDKGKVVAWNDDTEDRSMGLETHHADSYLRLKLPVNGRYFIRLSDAQGHGGEEYAYRLRVTFAQPDFALVVAPSSVNLRAGTSTVVTVHAMRRDGFDGDIDVSLEGAPLGFRLDGGAVPTGRDRIRMTITAPAVASKDPLVLSLVGRAKIGGATVARTASPAEDLMQAFAYRHLVPSERWIVTVWTEGRSVPPMEIAANGPVRIPFGGKGHVHVRAPGRPMPTDIHYELLDPPKGLSIEEVVVDGEDADLVIRSDAKLTQRGYEDNLIIEVFAGPPPARPNPKAPKVLVAEAASRVRLGVLPAVPIRVAGGT